MTRGPHHPAVHSAPLRPIDHQRARILPQRSVRRRLAPRARQPWRRAYWRRRHHMTCGRYCAWIFTLALCAIIALQLWIDATH